MYDLRQRQPFCGLYTLATVFATGDDVIRTLSFGPPYFLPLMFIGKTSHTQYGDAVFNCLIVQQLAGNVKEKVILFTPIDLVIEPVAGFERGSGPLLDGA